MSETFDWECPHCGKAATITEPNYAYKELTFNCNNKYGGIAFCIRFITCPSEKCKEYTLDVSLYNCVWNKTIQKYERVKLIKSTRLVPPSNAKVYSPAVIPQAIINDYQEACLILQLSPKASATLARRCLQGMIRNFWEVKLKSPKNTLYNEIEAIKDRVAVEDWQAIDGVRRIGNIGAHMQEDVNLIIDVDPREAEALIRLIEMLLADWYIERDRKRKLRDDVIKIAEEKQKKKESPKIAETETV